MLQSLYRFAEYDDSQAHLLCRAVVPLSLEHECFSDYIGPKTLEIAKDPARAVVLMRRSVERWCDWLDALVHFDTHMSWHLAPANFDADPEKRELAVLGFSQRHFGELTEFNKAWWEWHHGEAAERFRDSPKLPMLGKAMKSDWTRDWKYPTVDQIVICLWPPLKGVEPRPARTE